MSGVLDMLGQGQRGEFAPARPMEAPGAPPSEQPQQFDVLRALAEGQRGQFKAPPPVENKRPGVLGFLGQGIKEGIAGNANVPTMIPGAIGSLVLGDRAPRVGIDPGQYPEPENFIEGAARAIGQGLPSLPLMGAAAAASAPTVGRAAADAGLSMLSNAIPTIGGQIGGEAARQVAPPGAEDVFQTGGALAAGGIAALGQAGVGMALDSLARGPFSGVGRKQTFQGPDGEAVRATGRQADIAAERIRQEADASGPGGAERFQNLLDNAPEEIVPGSRPTTAQIAPLPGIAKLEDTVKSSGGGAAFMQRADQQNAARVAAVRDAAPANPWGAALPDQGAVGRFFVAQLDALEKRSGEAVAAQRAQVQQRTDTLGGQRSPTQYGQEMRGAVEVALEPVQAARRALWVAVDPDGTLALATDPIRAAAQRLRQELVPSDNLTAGENAALTHAEALAGVAPFSELQTLRSNILDAQRRSAFGEPLTTRGERRLTILKQSVDEAFAAAVEQKAAQEAHAVSAGVMTPEQTMLARLQAIGERGRAAAAADVGAGVVGGEGSGARAGTSEAPSVGVYGAGGQAGRGLGGAAGDQSLQGQARPLTPNFDEAAAARYAAAREATLREKERFGRGPVGDVLAGGKRGAPYRVLDADVPARIFSGKPSEPAQVQAYFKAVGGEQNGVALARDYLVSDLRRAGAIQPDGTIKPDTFARWSAKRSETIKLFPGLADEFASAQAAQTALDDVMSARTAALKEFQDGAAKHFLKEEPARAVEKLLNSADRVKNMQQAIGSVQGNADALASLRSHVVDYIVDRFTTPAKATEANAATPGALDAGSLRADAFKDWTAANKPWLRRLFGGQGVQNLEMVAADLRRQQLRTQATTGSQTAERGVAVAKHGAFRQHLPTALAIIADGLGHAGAGALGAGTVGSFTAGAGSAAAALLAHTLRQRGIATVNDLIREAMLHPAVARELMARQKAPTLGAIAQRRIASQLAAVAEAEAASRDGAQQ